jgi:hypothetical protein
MSKGLKPLVRKTNPIHQNEINMMQLRNDVKTIVDTVGAWEGIAHESHRFGGVQFNMGKVEIGHIHSNGMVDIPFTRKLREVLVAQGDAQPHHFLVDSGWITFMIRQPQDVAQAIRLYRLSYLQKGKRRGQVADIAAELVTLGFGDDVQRLLLGNVTEED